MKIKQVIAPTMYATVGTTTDSTKAAIAFSHSSPGMFNSKDSINGAKKSHPNATIWNNFIMFDHAAAWEEEGKTRLIGVKQ